MLLWVTVEPSWLVKSSGAAHQYPGPSRSASECHSSETGKRRQYQATWEASASLRSQSP